MRSINTPCKNSVVILGKLLTFDLTDLKTTSGAPMRRSTSILRVTQAFNGREETSEFKVTTLASKFKKDGTNSKMFDIMSSYNTTFKSADRFGNDLASHILINGENGNGILVENIYASKNDPERIIDSWDVNARFLSDIKSLAPGNTGESATFDVEMFILNKDYEVSAEGEQTGRLRIVGGIVRQTGSKPVIDCLTFYVENPGAIDYIDRNYSVNDTAHFSGRLRWTTTEQTAKPVENSWGDVIPRSNTRTVRELVITGPGYMDVDGPLPEERAYDPAEIRALLVDRETRKESAKQKARESAKKSVPATPNFSEMPMGFSWEG